MTDKDGNNADVTALGSRVRFTRSGAENDGSVTSIGVVIEDYADMVIERGSVGRGWAPVRRCTGGRSNSTTGG